MNIFFIDLKMYSSQRPTKRTIHHSNKDIIFQWKTCRCRCTSIVFPYNNKDLLTFIKIKKRMHLGGSHKRKPPLNGVSRIGQWNGTSIRHRVHFDGRSQKSSGRMTNGADAAIISHCGSLTFAAAAAAAAAAAGTTEATAAAGVVTPVRLIGRRRRLRITFCSGRTCRKPLTPSLSRRAVLSISDVLWNPRFRQIPIKIYGSDNKNPSPQTRLSNKIH